MVGLKFCEKLATRSNNFEIIVYGEEPRPAYDRVHLSNFFSGSSAEDLLLTSSSWYEKNSIKLFTGELVTKIDRNEKIIHTHSGQKDHYDILVLATGSAAFVPKIEGVERNGVFVYRTIEDLVQIRDYSHKAKIATVMGGGLLGLEAAKAMIDLRLQTHVIEFAPRLMPRQIDDDGSAILTHKLKELGIQVHTNKSTSKINGNGKLEGLTFADGTSLDTDMLVISAGIRPRDELARNSGIHVHERGGILVDDLMKTNDENIFAIGEAINHNGIIYGLVAPGYEMAEVVVRQLVNDQVRSFKGFDMSTKLKLLGVDVASFGDPFGETPGSVPIVLKDNRNGIYKRINISSDGKFLLGGILVGDAAQYNLFHQMVVNKMPLPLQPESLIFGHPNKSDDAGGIKNLPDAAQICSCENISKGELVFQITQNGVSSINELKKNTKACTGCGGCTPMVNDILKVTLESLGHKLKKTLCEHFDYSRQELYDIIKVKELKTFDLVLDSHGKGDGCEVCKPAVASLLASIWNEPIVNQSTIQ